MKRSEILIFLPDSHEAQMNNKFVFDYYNGITQKEAINRVKLLTDN